MQSFQLLDAAEFRDVGAGSAKALYADDASRTLLFALRNGQSIKEHHANTPLHIVVVSGRGLFTAGDGTEVRAEPHTLLLLAPGEDISATADEGELVFVAILHGAPHASADHAPVGG